MLTISKYHCKVRERRHQSFDKKRNPITEEFEDKRSKNCVGQHRICFIGSNLPTQREKITERTMVHHCSSAGLKSPSPQRFGPYKDQRA